MASHPSCPDKGHTEHLLYPSGQCHSQTCSSTCRNVFFLFQRSSLSHLYYLHANNSCDHMIPQLAANQLAKIHFCRFASTCFPSWGLPIAPARPQLQFPLGKTGNGNIIFQQQESSPEFYDYRLHVCGVFVKAQSSWRKLSQRLNGRQRSPQRWTTPL